MNNKGFAISGILYTILIIFMMLIIMMVSNLQDRKTVLDKLKSDAVNAVESDNKIIELEKRISILEDLSYAFLKSHPVGSIYITAATDENTVAKMNNKYGGTWQVYGAGRTLIGVGSNGTTNYATVNATGGSSTTSIGVANLPSHSHAFGGTTNPSGDHNHAPNNGANHGFATFDTTTDIAQTRVRYASTSAGSYWASYSGNTSTAGNHSHTFSGTTNPVGSNIAISVQDPYITVYMYKRIA